MASAYRRTSQQQVTLAQDQDDEDALSHNSFLSSSPSSICEDDVAMDDDDVDELSLGDPDEEEEGMACLVDESDESQPQESQGAMSHSQGSMQVTAASGSIRETYGALYGSNPLLAPKFNLARFIATRDYLHRQPDKRIIMLRELEAEEAILSPRRKAELAEAYAKSSQQYSIEAEESTLLLLPPMQAKAPQTPAPTPAAQSLAEALAIAAADVGLDEEMRLAGRPVPKYSHRKYLYCSMFPQEPIAGENTFELAQYLVTGDYLNKKSASKRLAKLVLLAELKPRVPPEVAARLMANYIKCDIAFTKQGAAKKRADKEWNRNNPTLYARSLARRTARHQLTVLANQGADVAVALSKAQQKSQATRKRRRKHPPPAAAAAAPHPPPLPVIEEPPTAEDDAEEEEEKAAAASHIFSEWLVLQRTLSADIQDLDRKVNGRLRGFYDTVLIQYANSS